MSKLVPIASFLVGSSTCFAYEAGKHYYMAKELNQPSIGISWFVMQR